MERITLMGSEDVYRAATIMRSAAEDMNRAASSIDGSLQQLKLFMEDWLQRFEFILKDTKNG